MSTNSTNFIMPTVFVAAEGFQLPGGFFAKEVTIQTEAEDIYEHFVFKAPRSHFVTFRDQQIIWWTKYNLNSLDWDDGRLPYEQLNEVLQTISGCRIVVTDNNARRWLRSFLPTAHIEELGGKIPTDLARVQCGRFHLLGGRRCSLAKAKYLRRNYQY